MQNPYNNFLKRQKQKPINNFKEKISNSLSGKTLNNTSMPNTTQSAIQSTIQKKIQPKTTPNATNAVSTATQTPNNINARSITPNVLDTPSNSSQGNSVITTPAPTQTSNQVISSTTPNTPTPQTLTTPNTPATDVSSTSTTGNVGMMSLSDINNSISTPAMARSVTPQTNTETSAGANARGMIYNPLDQNAIVPGTNMTQAQYEAEVKRKQEAGIALDNQELYNKYTNASTPYKYADQILQLQKDQADKNWQLQQQMFEQQQSNLQQQYEQSKKDAESAYNKSVDALNEQRYNQMQELNISGTNRGIQYSPQQLGLENVANINHNKNLLEASTSRNELLNKLQIEINKSLADLNMSHLQAHSDYQSNLNKYQADYYNQLMDWSREDNKTQDSRDWEQQLLEEKRKWEEAQAQKDKDFQQQMQNLQNQFEQQMQNSQNNWQSGENALDREHDKAMANSRSVGGGYSSVGGSGYSYSRGYTPYTYGGYQNYDGGTVSASALEDEITQQAVDNKFKQLSTDAYNAVDTGGVYDLMERADLYNDFVSPMYDSYYGLNSTVDERLDNTRETALKHLINKSVARSTNGAYNIGDTVYQHKSPLRKDYIDKVNKTKERTKASVLNKHSKNEGTKFRQNQKAKAESIHEKIMSGSKTTKNNSKSKTTKSSKSNDVNKKLGANNNKSIKQAQESKAKQKEKAKKEQKKRIEINKKQGAKNQAYIKKQMAEKKKQQERAKKFKDKVKKTVKNIFKKKK